MSKCAVGGLLSVLILAGNLFAQVPNEALANQIIAARQKNAALMKQYTWNSNLTFIDNGQTKDTRIDQVMYGPDGNIQRTVINDQSAPMPRGFLRRAVAEDKKKQMEQFLHGLQQLLDQYTLPSAGAMINVIAASNITTGQAPDGTPTLTINCTAAVVPGDNVTITINPTNFATRRVEVSTSYNGDAVNLTATFRTMPSGLNHMQFATITVPDKNITLNVQNYDYTQND